ncbi:GNAT family N-acetyltransferase [Luteococcus peritonei]|uniref:GNAT family N-acetyltransferase n=1 Tax=Luteococcus peritonei TaxID=88874 RepID=A0ABW4RV09_9ACTN
MDLIVTHNSEKNRYDGTIEGKLAGFIDYVPKGDVVELPHTEVMSEYEGQGIGSQLVRKTLDHLRAIDKKVEPSCPFVDGWIDKHEDYQDLRA